MSGLNTSPPVWKCPASARMKSLAVKAAIYLSMSKPLAKVTVMVSSTTARHRESTVTTVLPRFRPRLAQAMESRETPFPARFPAFLRVLLPSV